MFETSKVGNKNHFDISGLRTFFVCLKALIYIFKLLPCLKVVASLKTNARP